MMDLHESLDEIAGRSVAPSPNQVDADLARGRGALRRRRAVQAAGGSAFAIAAVVAAVSFTTAGTPEGGSDTLADRPAVTTTVTAPAGVKLVAYKGKQPEGFTVDTVPEGWFIQNSDLGSLVLAPSDRSKFMPSPGADSEGKPAAEPSVDPYDNPDSFVGKIVVMLQSKDQHEVPDGKKVDVGGQQGVLQEMDGDDDSKTLWVPQGKAPSALIQFWGGIGLSEAQMVELGAGVHVNEDAQQGVG